jgi:hypothetical protein
MMSAIILLRQHPRPKNIYGVLLSALSRSLRPLGVIHTRAELSWSPLGRILVLVPKALWGSAMTLEPCFGRWFSCISPGGLTDNVAYLASSTQAPVVLRK